MNKEFGFNGLDSEMNPAHPIGEGLEFRQVADSIQKRDFGEERRIGFNDVAENFSNRHGRVGAEVNDSKSIIFQQDMIKKLSAISKDKKEVKDFWDMYKEDISAYIGEACNSGDEKEIKRIEKYFNGLKRSVIGSSAVINFFEGQGFQVEFPSVKEDMEKKCDLKFIISDNNKKEIALAVQIKSSRLDRLNTKEQEEIIEKLILVNVERLEGKDKQDFRTLRMYCSSSSRSSKTYLPVFINIPVTLGSGNSRVDLVDESGKISKNLQKFMEDRWKEAKNNFDVDLDIDKDR